MVGLRSRALWLALAASLFVVVPASAEVPDASQPPRTSGPVVGAAIPCIDDGPAGPNEFKVQICGWTYLLAGETGAEDYTAYWLQMETDPGTDCVNWMQFRMKVPDGVRIVSAAPAEGGHIRRASALRTIELIVDGEGNAPVPGTIAQDVDLGAGRDSVEFDKREYKYVWRGHYPGKLNIAIGVQVAHATTIDEPFASWKQRLRGGGGPCRTSGTLQPNRGRGRNHDHSR